MVMAAVAGSDLAYVTGTVILWLDSPESLAAIASSASALFVMLQVVTISVLPDYLLFEASHQQPSLLIDLLYR